MEQDGARGCLGFSRRPALLLRGVLWENLVEKLLARDADRLHEVGRAALAARSPSREGARVGGELPQVPRSGARAFPGARNRCGLMLCSPYCASHRQSYSTGMDGIRISSERRRGRGGLRLPPDLFVFVRDCLGVLLRGGRAVIGQKENVQ